MTEVDNIEKGACLCRSCKNVFQSSEIEHIYIERNGQLVYEAVCPYCGSTYFGLIDYPVSEEKLIYKNYTVNISDKERKRKLMEKYDLYDEEELEFYQSGYLIGRLEDLED